MELLDETQLLPRPDEGHDASSEPQLSMRIGPQLLETPTGVKLYSPRDSNLAWCSMCCCDVALAATCNVLNIVIGNISVL